MKVTKLIFALVLFSSTAVGQLSPFTYRECITTTLRNNYQPAPCEITGNSVPTSIWMIQVGAYRNGITPLPGMLMIPYELNRYYLFAFNDVGQYNGSLFFSSKDAAAKFIQDNGLNELFCQVFPAQFPFSDIVAYTDPGNVYAYTPLMSNTVKDTSQVYVYDSIPVQTYTDYTAKSMIYHQVQKGDTLYSISKKYNVTIDSVKKLNNLPSDSLSINTVLKIK